MVDLPAPLGPRKPRISPSGTLNVRSSTAIRSRYRLVSPVTSIIAVIALSFLYERARDTMDGHPAVNTRSATVSFRGPAGCNGNDPT